MKHYASPDFWQVYNRLPESVQVLADKQYELLKANPQHPSLHLKQVGRFWSVRVGLRHRALAVTAPGGLLWLWIGVQPHPEKCVVANALFTLTGTRLHNLLDAFALSHERLVRGLNGSNYDAMCPPSGYGKNTLGESLAYFQFHEAQHAGQLLYLANFIGKESV